MSEPSVEMSVTVLTVFLVLCNSICASHDGRRIDHHVVLQDVSRLLHLEQKLLSHSNFSDRDLNKTLKHFGDLVAKEIGKLSNLVEHPINLFHLYRHWSNSCSIWEQFNKKFNDSIVSEMVQLAPTMEDCQGKYFLLS